MAPTEPKILSSYLLAPSQLPSIISLKEFTELFPRSQQSSPQVRALYRDLQSQRNTVIDSVSTNIETEAKRGKALRREAIRARREAEDQEFDAEIEIERALYGNTHASQKSKHNLVSIIPELENASNDLEVELQDLEEEEARLLQSVQLLVGNMSDLRYGRLANGQLRRQVLEGLENVKETCKRKT